MGVDLEQLEGPRLVHALMQLFVEDEMFEKEVVEARKSNRAHLLRTMSGDIPGYDSYEEYGRSNDNFGASSEEPLPYIPVTDQTEDGYVGMLPPLA